MKKIVMTSFIALSLTFLSNTKSFAAMDAPIKVAPMERSLMIYTDFLKKSIKELGARLEKLNEDKGHDEEAYKRIVKLHMKLEELQGMLKQLETVKVLPIKSANLLTDIGSGIKSIERMIVSEAIEYPMKCKNLKVGGDIQEYQGIVEKFVNKWVLSFADDKEADGLRRIHIDEKVGTIGRASDYALSLTPDNFYVKGLVEESGEGGKGLVRCLSIPMPVSASVK